MTSHMIVFRAALSKDVAPVRQSSWKDRSKVQTRSLPASVKRILDAKRD